MQTMQRIQVEKKKKLRNSVICQNTGKLEEISRGTDLENL